MKKNFFSIGFVDIVAVLALLLCLPASYAAPLGIDDGSFEFGTFNSSVVSGPTALFVYDPLNSVDGDNYGLISATAPSNASLRIFTVIEIGYVQPGESLLLSFYAKRPSVDGFSGITPSVGDGVSVSAIKTVLDAPSSLTAVWMIHSYQFDIPVNWDPTRIARLTLKGEPISGTEAGRAYGYHIDGLSFTQISSAAIPEPGIFGLTFGLICSAFCVLRKRRLTCI